MAGGACRFVFNKALAWNCYGQNGEIRDSCRLCFAQKHASALPNENLKALLISQELMIVNGTIRVTAYREVCSFSGNQVRDSSRGSNQRLRFAVCSRRGGNRLRPNRRAAAVRRGVPVTEGHPLRGWPSAFCRRAQLSATDSCSSATGRCRRACRCARCTARCSGRSRWRSVDDRSYARTWARA